MKCTSCNKEVTDDYISFPCPDCGTKIVRCYSCRELSAKYSCPNPECNYTGP